MNAKARFIALAIFIGCVLVTSAIMFFAFPDVLRTHVLKPLITVYFIGRYYLEFVPQYILWMIPPLIAALIMGRRVVRLSKQNRPTQAQQSKALIPREGELAQLSQQLRRARHSRFARVRLSRELVEISARLIASKESVPLWRARQWLADSYWRDNLAIHHFLSPRRHYTTRESGTGFHHSLKDVIQHLEEFEHHV